jgi:putative salt-induced outer membrane protein YdiY
MLNLSALAQEGGLETTVAGGVTLTDGNSETLLANGSVVSEGEDPGLGSIRFGVEGNYGENTVDGEKSTTTENVTAFGNAKKTLSEMTFAYLDARVLHDDIASIKYRATIGPGLGLYLLKDDAASLSVEAGPSYVWEEVDGVTDNYLALRVGERYERALSETSKVWQSLEYLPEVSDFNNYQINAELGMEAALNATLNLRLVLQDRYEGQPAEGNDSNDLTLIGGVSMTL